MPVYIVSRWGNPDTVEGPDGEDTNFLVRAASVSRAARLVDAELSGMASHLRDNRAVETFSHFAVEVAADHSNATESIIHGPWFAHALIREPEHKTWRREKETGDWVADPI
jgi:hypothetical protein